MSNIKDVTELEQIVAAAMNVLGKIVTLTDSSSHPFIIEIKNGDRKDLEALGRYNLNVKRVAIH